MNRYARIVTAIATLVLLAGAALLLNGADARAGGSCITTYGGYWALVEIGPNEVCTGENDSGILQAVSNIPGDQAKPAVLRGDADARGFQTFTFFYEEDRQRDSNLRSQVIPTTARRSPISPLNQNARLRVQGDQISIQRDLSQRVFHGHTPRTADGEYDPAKAVLPPADLIEVEYVTPDGDHRAISDDGECYREWRDENGDWRRSGSYGADDEACRQASWNAYQRSQGGYLHDPASPSRFPTGEAPGTLNKLVGNTGRTANANAQFGRMDQAQAFRTGSHTKGYTVRSVKFRLTQGTGDDLTFSVSIYSADANGLPGASLATLAQPESLAGEGLRTFTTPEGGVALDPNRVYWIVIDTTVPGGTNRIAVRATVSNAEDGDGAAGWNIANDRYHRDWDAAQWTVDYRSLLIEIDGYANP